MLSSLRLICLASSVPILLMGCVTSPSDLGVSKQKWASYDKAKRHQLLVAYNKVKQAQVKALKKTAYAGPKLTVYVAVGKVRMPVNEKYQPYQGTNFTISPAQCKSVKLRSLTSRESVKLKACYNGLTLSLDPSRIILAKSNGTVHFTLNPIWKRGFTYTNVSTSGYANLLKAHITIKALPKVAPIEDDSFYNS